MDMETLLADLTSETQTAPAVEETKPETPTEGEQEAKTETETETDEQSAEADAEGDGEEDKDKAPDEDEDAEKDDEDKPKREPRSRRMKRQLEALRSENEALKAARAATESESASDAAPKFEDYNGDYEKYETARIEWAARKTVREQQRVLDAQREHSVETQVRTEVLREFQSQQNDARKALKDFDQVLAKGTTEVARHVGELIIESDKAALLQYHLAQRPDLLRELNSLNDKDAARRIGRLEARLSLPTAKTATKAPPPPKTEPRGAATPRSPEADLDAWLTKKYGKKSA